MVPAPFAGLPVQILTGGQIYLQLERFDINLYYRALDLKWDNSKAIQEFLDFLRLSRQGKFYLDAFVGYQKQRAAIL